MRTEHAPILIDRAEVEKVEYWCPHHQQTKLFPLRRRKRFGMGPQILKRFYNFTIESMVASLPSMATARPRPQGTTEGTVNGPVHKLPAIQDLYTRRCQRKALKIVKDSSHPSHRLFSLLPHGKRYRSAKSSSKGLLYSFYPQAIRLFYPNPALNFFTTVSRTCLVCSLFFMMLSVLLTDL